MATKKSDEIMKTRPLVKKITPVSTKIAAPLLADIRNLVEAARQHVAQTANAAQSMLCWQVGQRIHREVLQENPQESILT
ncbi:MAG: hypothetical protein LBU11_00680 [Zoogloeaceae bacterium]|jgi:hypothetical protein|nr:hypothetical protein [Zoogloeaceae bacterium]